MGLIHIDSSRIAKKDQNWSTILAAPPLPRRRLDPSMLRQLTISHYAIVDHLDIDLKSGMTVITGETGAGKSIMLDALSLALGGRAERDVIRVGADRAEITACFTLSDNQEASLWLREHDLDDDDNPECLLRRVITRDRSKAYINGQPVTLNDLQALGDMLVDIHSQHEHQSLLRQTTHQKLLDAYCRHQSLVNQVNDLANQWRELAQSLAQLRNNASDNNARFELLGYQVKELDALDLAADEFDALELEQKQLSHAEASLASHQQLLDLLSENDEFNLRRTLNQALGLLSSIAYPDKHTENAANLLNTALIQIEEASDEVGHAIDKVDLNPERLEAVNQRLADILQMARKHKTTPRALPSLHAALQEELAGMSSADTKIEQMDKQLSQLARQYQEAASQLSSAREAGAKRLAAEINAQLAHLGMAGARLSLALNTDSQCPPRPNGYESTEFLISTNLGQPPKPLAKIASGGELSRVSLAIQVVTAQTCAIPSLVFDEVDVGIGGGVAKACGELLRQLGEKGQVLCVTHQPQVASQGHQHLFVSSAMWATAPALLSVNCRERPE
jgi:DNA repair protein RecN (Recombination protein N)